MNESAVVPRRLETIRWQTLDAGGRARVLERPGTLDRADLDEKVRRIIDDVRLRGDRALSALTERFDGVRLETFEVSLAEFDEAERSVPTEIRVAMTEARERLILWHRAGMAAEFQIDTAPGVSCGRILRGIRRVGLYVPAGSAPLPSTALMLGVPASLADCDEVILCTPPRRDGRADPTVLVAARLCGITRVFKVGGAQAIAAMAQGTTSIPRCDKLFGPGNSFVTRAKEQVSTLSGGPAIDMPAGPSEVLVIADAGARPEFVAADLLAQSEHGPDSQVLLLTDAPDLLPAVRAEIDAQLERLPRADIAQRSLDHARLILVDTIDTAISISNDYAPEHLILALRSPADHLPKIRAAGSVFLGDHTPESLGDYCSGTNHVLPTNGAARAFSGVSVASFQNSISVQSATREGLVAIGPCAVTLARAEGLEAHAQAVVRRLESRS
ncbi:MAG: histidinol dehydrogenase [Vicinamibacteria bacterium]|jgi:histidinol dehydrogenase|nr:histidinol dehydrogenase [Vicinamibacteria bacterium]